MQIVIDIPEEVYKEICDKNYYSLKGKEALRIGVINGTVLPKGHGHERLMILSEAAVEREQTPLRFSCQNWISEVGLSNATVAIIEADKSESKGAVISSDKRTEMEKAYDRGFDDGLEEGIKDTEPATLDKIRAEIEQLTYYWCEANSRSAIDDVLLILDKYKAKSEGGVNK